MSLHTRHLVVFAHPNPESFNHAILRTAVDTLRAAGDTVEVSDLYAESFSPSLVGDELMPGAPIPGDVRREQERVQRANSLVFLYPTWWFDRPAILKGWCDRVLRPGFAYRPDPTTGVPVGLLGEKRASLVVTFGAQEGQCDLDQIVSSMTIGTLGFCGIGDVESLPLWGVPTVSSAARDQMLVDVQRFLVNRRVSESLADVPASA